MERCRTRAIAVPTDVTSANDLATLVSRTEEELGPVDLLVNNAGLECVGYFEQIDPAYIERTVATNLTAVIVLTRLVVPGMLERGHGHVANIASMAGKVARPWGAVYSATKHGVVGFSWSLRAELARRGVGVSVICPHYVSGEGMFAEREERVKDVRGMKTVSPQEVAEKTVWAIENNKAEVVIAPVMMKMADVVHALSPDAIIGLAWRSGMYDLVRKEATGD